MKKLIVFSLLFCGQFSYGKIAKSSFTVSELETWYQKKLTTQDLKVLKKKTLALKGKAVPTLIKVMKSSTYPDKNRWTATFLLGRIMGKKSSGFISKFSQHPNWVMRLASLKTLQALGETRFKTVYEKSLKDKSMIVRYQALEMIDKLKMKEMAPQVWSMLYDKRNYHTSKKTKNSKRTHIIKNVIKTVGNLKFQKAKKPLLSMLQKKKYKDIYLEIDYALSMITGKKAPGNTIYQKKNFWKKFLLSETLI